MPAYTTRCVDKLLDEYLPHLPAIALEGAKGVGKTETALQRAHTTLRMDLPAVHAMLEADPQLITSYSGTVLLDEWQRFPASWDIVRRAVDDGTDPASFLLTGSAYPPDSASIHSGAGRIDSVRMRPFGIQERPIADTRVVVEALFAGQIGAVEPATLGPGIADYAHEICRSGFPGIMDLPERIRTVRLDSYLSRIVTHDFPEQGLKVRNPEAVRHWMQAYALATSLMDTYQQILDRATPGESDKPSRSTTNAYRALLEQLMILEPLEAWSPLHEGIPRLAKAPKHHLCDPALAARVLGFNQASLLSGSPKSADILAQLFESLVVLTVRVAAESFGATTRHLRTADGKREIDVVVEDAYQNVVGIEVKLSGVVRDNDVAHLLWLQEKLGEKFKAGMVVHAGKELYTRPDGIVVVPLAALG